LIASWMVWTRSNVGAAGLWPVGIGLDGTVGRAGLGVGVVGNVEGAGPIVDDGAVGCGAPVMALPPPGAGAAPTLGTAPFVAGAVVAWEDAVPLAATPFVAGVDAVPEGATPVVPGEDAVPFGATPFVPGTDVVPFGATPFVPGADVVPVGDPPFVSGADEVPLDAAPFVAGAVVPGADAAPALEAAPLVDDADVPPPDCCAITAVPVSSNSAGRASALGWMVCFGRCFISAGYLSPL
jgi:hypothetical protein